MKSIDFSKKALICYITAGFPDMELTKKAVLTLQDVGVSAIEIGVPYSDPVADGKTIALASHLSLQKGCNLDVILQGLDEIKERVSVPLYLMSYYSPVYSYGEERLFQKAKDAGVTGFIIPDLPLDEGELTFRRMKEYALDPILLAFPNTGEKRLKKISEAGGSFIYYVNLFGTTGVRDAIPEESLVHLKQLKSHSKKPICAGFGVSNRKMFEKLSSVADGVIIGSAIVKKLIAYEKEPERMLREIREFVLGLLEKQ